tara:strand:- start:2991 stop:3368 length:378 start_codon:yes stop_codon:yes gene_type:complete
LLKFLEDQDVRSLLGDIPAPKLVDLGVGMARGDISFKDFLNIKDEFSSEFRYLSDYRLMYEIGVKKTDGACSEPCTDLSVLQSEMDAIRSKMDSQGMDRVSTGETLIDDIVQPNQVQQVNFTSSR